VGSWPQYSEGCVEEATVARLRELNREFYRVTATEFSRSRRVLQPGLARVLDATDPGGRVLDLGCGDARFGRALVDGPGVRQYVGVDESAELLSQFPATTDMSLVALDLLEVDWPLEWSRDPFDLVVAFSVLHHLPGAPLRQRFLESMRACLAPGGRWVISVWQVLHRERFLRRRVHWSEVGLEESDVDDQDLLLDWQRGVRALRYVHHFEEDELRELCEKAGLHVQKSWRSDGDSGDLGLYLRGD
jgi:tRNA (uracil-5-)-methyltransferase TRM9